MSFNISLHYHLLRGLSQHFLLLGRAIVSKWGFKTNTKAQVFAPHNSSLVISVISQLFLVLRNSQSIIKYFGRHHAPGIQRWGFNPTVWIFLQYLGGIKSPSFSVSYIKAPEHHFLLFSLQFIISRAFKHPNSLLIRSFIILSKGDFKDPQELRRSICVLVYVSSVFTTPFISSDNLLGSLFSLPQIQNG